MKKYQIVMHFPLGEVRATRVFEGSNAFMQAQVVRDKIRTLWNENGLDTEVEIAEAHRPMYEFNDLMDNLIIAAQEKNYTLSSNGLQSEWKPGTWPIKLIPDSSTPDKFIEFDIHDEEDEKKLWKFLRPNPIFLGREYKPAFEIRLKDSMALYGYEICDDEYVWEQSNDATGEGITSIYCRKGDGEGPAECDQITEMDYNKPQNSLGNTHFEIWKLSERNS